MLRLTAFSALVFSAAPAVSVDSSDGAYYARNISSTVDDIDMDTPIYDLLDPSLIDISLSDDDILLYSEQAIDTYERLASGNDQPEDQTALAVNPFHQTFVSATVMMFGEGADIEAACAALVDASRNGEYDAVGYYRVATAVTRDSSLLVEAQKNFDAPRKDDVEAMRLERSGAPGRRLLWGCGCTFKDLGKQKCWCPCEFKGITDQACSVLCRCRSGFHCHPGVMRCYHEPRWIREPCIGGKGKNQKTKCGTGLTCEPFIQKCYNEPREANEPCTFKNCADGVYCITKNLGNKCYLPPQDGQASSDWEDMTACVPKRGCRSGYTCDESLNSRDGWGECVRN